MNVDIFFGCGYIFAALMFIWNAFDPWMVPEFVQRVSYLIIAGMMSAFAYDILVLGESVL